MAPRVYKRLEASLWQDGYIACIEWIAIKTEIRGMELATWLPQAIFGY